METNVRGYIFYIMAANARTLKSDAVGGRKWRPFGAIYDFVSEATDAMDVMEGHGYECRGPQYIDFILETLK